MKCIQHGAEAVGVCPWCGRAVCAACAPEGPRLACSRECAGALARDAAALEILLQKSRQSARANSVNCYLLGGILAGMTVAAWYELPSPLLMCFTGACAIALFISGAWFGGAARKMKI